MISGSFPDSKLFPSMSPELASLTLDAELRKRGYEQDAAADNSQAERSVRVLRKIDPGIQFMVTAQVIAPNITIIGKTDCLS